MNSEFPPKIFFGTFIVNHKIYHHVLNKHVKNSAVSEASISDSLYIGLVIIKIIRRAMIVASNERMDAEVDCISRGLWSQAQKRR